MKILTLDKLPLNITAKIYSLNCDDILRRRLLDLGLINGTEITPVFYSPFEDPVAYKIRSSTIALRKDDIRNVMCVVEN